MRQPLYHGTAYANRVFRYSTDQLAAARRARALPSPQMSNDLTMGEAAAALHVSVDTLRRWDRAGRLRTRRDSRNRRMIPA